MCEECLRRDIIVELNVGKGDTLEKLADMYHIPFEKMLAANEGMPTQAPSGAIALFLGKLAELIAEVLYKHQTSKLHIDASDSRQYIVSMQSQWRPKLAMLWASAPCKSSSALLH